MDSQELQDAGLTNEGVTVVPLSGSLDPYMLELDAEDPVEVEDTDDVDYDVDYEDTKIPTVQNIEAKVKMLNQKREELCEEYKEKKKTLADGIAFFERLVDEVVFEDIPANQIFEALQLLHNMKKVSARLTIKENTDAPPVFVRQLLSDTLGALKSSFDAGAELRRLSEQIQKQTADLEKQIKKKAEDRVYRQLKTASKRISDAADKAKVKRRKSSHQQMLE